jgi:hypothetical protein
LSQALLLVLPALAYANSLRVPFALDDDTSIVVNPAIGTWAGHESASRRIAYLTLKLNYALGGLDPLGYHLVNLAIHLLSGLVVFALVRRLLLLAHGPGGVDDTVRDRAEGAALAGALIFALHPIQTQAVTYVVQRIASLATLFYATAMLLYVVARTAARPGRRLAALVAALVSAGAAMFTKEIAFTLPLAILLLELVFFEASPRRRLAILLPLLGMLALIPLVYASRGLSVLDKSLGGSVASRLSYAATQPGVVVRYLRLLLWPVGQNLDHDVPLEPGFGSPAVLASLLLLLALGLGALALLSRRRGPGARIAGAGGLFFFLALSVESSVVPLADTMFEHRLYLPMLGVALVAAGALDSAWRAWPERQRWLSGGAAVWIAALGVATVARNHVWRSGVSLWSDVAEKSPRKPRAHYNLAEALRNAGDVEGAIREWSRTLELDPRHSLAANQLGSAAWVSGDLGLAERWYRRAVEGIPANPEAHYNLALLLEATGRPDEAVAHYRAFLAGAPTYLAAEAEQVKRRFGWR